MNRMPLIFFRLFLVGLLVLLFLFLADTNLAIDGTLEIRKAVNKTSPYVSRLLPDERTGELYRDSEGVWREPVIADPTYFTLTAPRNFERVDLELVFDPEDIPVVEVGLLMNADSEQYHLKPVYHRLLEELDWPQVREGDVVLYDRLGRYETLADFLVDPPPLSEIASYHYAFNRPYVLPGYVPSRQEQKIDVSLRGTHEFLTYIEDEELRFAFEYMDMNRTLGADEVTVLVFDRAGELVASKKHADDGNEYADARGSESRAIEVRANVPDGVYKVILKTNRDVFFRSIRTSQQKMVFLNEVFFGDEVGYQDATRPRELWTDAKEMTFETPHAEGVQEIVVGRSIVDLREPLTPLRAEVRGEGLVPVRAPHGNVFVRGAGHYVLSESHYFNPDPVRLSWNTDLEALGITAVIATYTPPGREGDALVGMVGFDTMGAPKVRDAWKFVLSLPGIYEHKGGIELVETRAILHRAPTTWIDLWKKLVPIF